MDGPADERSLHLAPETGERCQQPGPGDPIGNTRRAGVRRRRTREPEVSWSRRRQPSGEPQADRHTGAFIRSGQPGAGRGNRPGRVGRGSQGARRAAYTGRRRPDGDLRRNALQAAGELGLHGGDGTGRGRARPTRRRDPDSTPNIADLPALVVPERCAKGGIAFQNVSFAYERERPVLLNVSLNVPAGATVALVGPSGAGKTTLVGLLPRFYDPDTGHVLLDGRDLRSLPLAWLRQNVALVLQEPVLFSASIFENIAYGRPGATKQAVIAAADSAGVSEFVRKFPEGFDTQVGERGVSLSGGQRQRISIARAFLKDAPVLIMDEPTSALDAETETQLLAALDRLKRGRTTLIVAHRLSTIREADLIVAMRDGHVVETGSHQELAESGGLYAKLYAAQHLSRSPAVAAS